MKCFSKWESVEHGVAQGLILEPLFFLLNNNDLPKIISDMSKLILFSDDMSKIVKNSTPYKLKKKNIYIYIYIYIYISNVFTECKSSF